MFQMLNKHKILFLVLIIVGFLFLRIAIPLRSSANEYISEYEPIPTTTEKINETSSIPNPFDIINQLPPMSMFLVLLFIGTFVGWVLVSARSRELTLNILLFSSKLC